MHLTCRNILGSSSFALRMRKNFGVLRRLWAVEKKGTRNGLVSRKEKIRKIERGNNPWAFAKTIQLYHIQWPPSQVLFTLKTSFLSPEKGDGEINHSHRVRILLL